MSIERHLRKGSTSLVVTFGSFTNPGRPIPSYAFMQSLRGVQKERSRPFDIVYLLARDNDWYMSGIDALPDGFDASAEALTELVAGYREVLFLGNSMGAYAALAFGYRCPGSRILAISPQTRFDPDFTERIREIRWAEARAAMCRNFDVTRFDLRRLILDSANPDEIAASVHVGADNPRDMAYARWIEGVPGLKLYTIAGEGHDLAHSLRASGTLSTLIHRELDILDGAAELPQGRSGN